MLNSSASLWLGVIFVLIGAINVWLILQASARVRDAKASTRLIAAHRIGGYLFIALFCVMGVLHGRPVGRCRWRRSAQHHDSPDPGDGPEPSSLREGSGRSLLQELLFSSDADRTDDIRSVVCSYRHYRGPITCSSCQDANSLALGHRSAARRYRYQYGGLNHGDSDARSATIWTASKGLVRMRGAGWRL